MLDCLIENARRQYHKNLIDSGVLAITAGVATNADKSSRPSKAIAAKICALLHVPDKQAKLEGQTAGRLFEEITMSFINTTFPALQSIRPGEWFIQRTGNHSAVKTNDFVQYEHLADLAELIKENPVLAASLGNDYIIGPDIIVARKPCADAVINSGRPMVNMEVARHSPLRMVNNTKPILHASISAKWTMRSDRSQNSRTEALNLIRNRKGHLPHIVVATAEPMPTRLASLALGTGDIDCIYHFALNELIQAVDEYAQTGHEDAKAILDMLVNGKRLKDISDLPLDLAI